MSAQRFQIDEQRQRWCHGPIDLIVQVEGEPEVVVQAHARAWAEFQTLLPELVQELPLLRRPVQAHALNPLRGEVARAMWQACQPLAGPTEDGFITPMAAVAGAVAQQVLRHYRSTGIWRASVNNGGDIALHVAPGQRWRLGVVADISKALTPTPAGLEPDAAFDIDADAGIGGVATSGWSGRSFSMGIADSVTVLAATAAQADAAATMIANRVNTQHPGIVRQPANQVRDDSDLGDRWVTRHVPTLPLGQIRTALHNGLAYAQGLQRRGLISCALLVCQQQSLVCGSTLDLLAA
jgi:ApbE superfamily uncharacterized protein (UPF0280 family)